MKIAIEAQRIFRTNKHGMDFVALECIRELQTIDKQNEYFIIVKPGEDHCLEESENMHIIELNCPTYPLWEQFALPYALKKIKPDILHCTSNTAPIFCPVPLILTLHDIIFLEKRQSNNKSIYQNLGWYYRRYVVPRIIKHCKKIITVSNFECQRIQKALNIPKDILIAVYNGYNSYFRPQEADYNIIHKYITANDYIFFLGNTDPKKNAQRTIKAYSIYLEKSTIKRKLLIADLKEEYIDEILKKEHIESIKPYLAYPGYIYNKDLAALYNGAYVFLYPSLRESFGIPMLESMACGTPVIAGNTSAMPEIAGEDNLLVDPYNENDIASKLLELENDDTLYKKYVAYGLERVKSFSWKNSAQQLLNIYQSL
jgi:glycosyltransferase involved in cell wall biosynthesis